MANRPMRCHPASAILVLLLCSQTAFAQRGPDPLSERLIPPELVMRHGAQIGVAPSVLEDLSRQMAKLGPELEQMHRELTEVRHRLIQLLSAEQIDPSQATEALDAMLELEKQQKLKQVSLMVALRAKLTADQRRQLIVLQKESPQGLRRTASGSVTVSDEEFKPLPPNLSDANLQNRFYQPDRVQAVELKIADADIKRMYEALPKRIYVPASFRWHDIAFPKVAVRFKGNSSSHPNQQHKRSFLIKFNEYQPKTRFIGLRRVSFDNGVQFGSLFSEPVITGILRDLKIPTHRCNYAKLYVNGRFQGVYTNVERIDETFLEHRFGARAGALYKVDEGGPGCNLQLISEDPAAYEKTFESKSKKADKSYEQLVSLIRTINETPADEFSEELARQFELDSFLDIAAVMLLAGAFDQLTGWGPHNYYLHLDSETERWRYLPWDLDVGFCETAFGKLDILGQWHAAWPLTPSGRPNPLMERITADPELLSRYRERAAEILETYFQPDHLCQQLDSNFALIRESLANDPFPHRRVTVASDRGYEGIVESIKVFIRKRYALAKQQLSEPGPRPAIRHSPQQGQLPPHLAQKLQHVEQRARQMQRAGKDVSPIQRILSTLPALIGQGKHEEAERVLDEALKRTE